MAKAKKSRKWLIFTTILLLGAGGAVYWKFLRKREQVITVQTEKISRRNLTEIVVANGKIQPVLQVVINPEVSGEIIELPVREGQSVKKGDLLVRIKPDYYQASRNSADASYKSALAGKTVAGLNLDKAEQDFARIAQLSKDRFVSESALLEAKTIYEVAKSQRETALHQCEMANAALARAEEDLKKTAIFSPIEGSVTKLKSQIGERVVGTAMMAGTEIMTVANLNDMEARVDVNEIDVVLIGLAQTARLEVDAFRDRKFTGKVYEIANASKGSGPQNSSSGGGGGGSQNQEATKFEVKIRVSDRERFRPGMSVTAEIETRYRTNVLAAPIQSVTIRAPKSESKGKKGDKKDEPKERDETDAQKLALRRKAEMAKPKEVVFVADANVARMRPVKRGVSDDSYVEIMEGLAEGDEVISGGYKAINRELEDGKKIKIDNSKPERKEKKDETAK